MKITQVEQQKNNKNRYNIFLDGSFAFGADEDLVVDRRLIVGKEVQQQDLAKLLEEAKIGKLMERMYRWFGVRMRSEREVRQKFKIQNLEFKISGKELISDMVVDALVNKLIQKGLVNDLEFAKAWVDSRSKKKGVNALKAELISKGIKREIIEQVLSSKYQVSSEAQTAEKLLERKMRVWKNLSEAEFKQKALQFLMRRGFSYETSKQVLEKVVKKE